MKNTYGPIPITFLWEISLCRIFLDLSSCLIIIVFDVDVDQLSPYCQNYFNCYKKKINFVVHDLLISYEFDLPSKKSAIINYVAANAAVTLMYSL